MRLRGHARLGLGSEFGDLGLDRGRESFDAFGEPVGDVLSDLFAAEQVLDLLFEGCIGIDGDDGARVSPDGDRTTGRKP